MNCFIKLATAIAAVLCLTGLLASPAGATAVPETAGQGGQLTKLIAHDGLCASWAGPLGGRGGEPVLEVQCKIARIWDLKVVGSGLFQFEIWANHEAFSLGLFRGHVVLVRSSDTNDSWMSYDEVPVGGPYGLTYFPILFFNYVLYLHANGRMHQLGYDADGTSLRDCWATNTGGTPARVR